MWNDLFKRKTTTRSYGQVTIRKTQLAQQVHVRRTKWAATDSMILKKIAKVGSMWKHKDIQNLHVLNLSQILEIQKQSPVHGLHEAEGAQQWTRSQAPGPF